MEFIDLIEKQRDIYVRQLNDFYESRTNGAKELLLSFNTEESVLLFNYSRMDYVEKREGEGDKDVNIEELSPDSYIDHSPVDFQMAELTISLHPFYWHGCEFIISPRIDASKFIENWAKKWIDEDGILESNDRSNAIHSVTIPDLTPDDTRFTVDFGTSPCDCFLELISEIEQSGASMVTINSFDLIPNES